MHQDKWMWGATESLLPVTLATMPPMAATACCTPQAPPQVPLLQRCQALKLLDHGTPQRNVIIRSRCPEPSPAWLDGKDGRSLAGWQARSFP
jgi:hypothetical protein